MKKAIIFLFLISVLSPCFCCEAVTIKAAYTNWFPYTYAENGDPLGFEIEIFNEIAKKMNIQVQFFRYPWNRCLNYLKIGKVDVVISLLKTDEREKYTYFPDTDISISKTMLFTTRKDIEFNGSYESLEKYTIGVISGFSYGEKFDKSEFLKKEPVIDAPSMIRKLLYGRHDLAVENQLIVSAYAKKMGVLEKLRFLSPPIHSQKLYVGFSKANHLKNMCDDFSKNLMEFKNSDSYRVILEKYGVNPAAMMEKKAP